MMMETIMSRSMRLMFSGSVALGLGMMAQQAVAQEVTTTPDTSAAQPVQRVEITGSSIKRITKEGALPVQTLTAADIAKTGATSASDLVQMLPAMQGFVPSSSSVNGGGGGATTAALHSLQSKYTLVLLDGQRMAPTAVGAGQGGGFAVNLESIPLDAIERVEILTDGASAVYGSDAIAGVVNFITKKNKTDGTAFATYNSPQHPGAKSFNLGVSKGFGDLDKDNYNILFSLSHDEQKSLLASQRSFSALGAYIPFSSGGTHYVYDQRTGNTEPANISFTDGNGTSHAFNPYYTANGNCGTPMAGVLVSSATSTTCRFNYAATVQDIPESTRTSALLKGAFKLNSDTMLTSELVYSHFDMMSQFAPSAQPMGLNTTTRLPALYNAYVVPFLTANGLTNPSNKATMSFRSVAVGGRADDWITDATHFNIGVNGTVAGWGYNAGLTLSQSIEKDNAAGGYTDYDQFAALVAAGSFDPVMSTDGSPLKPALLNGTNFSKTTSTLNTVHFGAQHDVMELSGGTSIVSLGGDFTQTHYKTDYSSLLLSQSGFSTQPASQDYPVGGSYGAVPFDASRNNYGLFGELLLPVLPTLEATVAARYDSYSKTHSNAVFSSAADPVTGLQNQIANADLGNTFNDGTYKLSLRWTPVESVLLRGSYGTGFKAPNISDIAGATTYAGSSSGSYLCPFPGSPGCQPGSAQYDLLSGPNGLSGSSGLKPEKSTQWTLGFRVEPLKGLSGGLDLWDVQIKNQVLSAGIPEQLGFANPTQYASLFTNPYQDPAGYTTIAYTLAPSNGGVANYRGLDWDLSYRNIATPIGKLALATTGTYMITQNYTLVAGGAENTDLGVFGPDNAVVFRVQARFSAELQTGAFTNGLVANYKSGYHDESFGPGFVYLANPDGSRGATVAFGGLQVPSYTTWDYQGKYQLNKALAFTAGIKNLFDRNPPLTLQNAGGGNQGGYDGRYADPIGRTFYLSGNYKF